MTTSEGHLQAHKSGHVSASSSHSNYLLTCKCFVLADFRASESTFVFLPICARCLMDIVECMSF